MVWRRESTQNWSGIHWTMLPKSWDPQEDLRLLPSLIAHGPKVQFFIQLAWQRENGKIAQVCQES